MNANIDNHNEKKEYPNKSLNSLNNNSNNTFDNNNDEKYFIKDILKAKEEILKKMLKINIPEKKSFSKITPKNEEKLKNNKNNNTNKDNDNTLNNTYEKYFQTSTNILDILNVDNNKESDLSSESKITKTNNIKYKLINNYKNWNGDNYFIFNCHMLEGPTSFRPTLLTACVLILPTILFLSFNSQYIAEKITIVIPIIILILCISSLFFLLIVTFVDPGIIRRFNIDDHNNYIVEKNLIKIFHLGYIKNYKYCPTCGIIRPNRSSHCQNCNNCVERYDHHCPWIGNCVAKRNYIYFFLFLILLNTLSILIVVFCIIHIILKVKYFSDLNEDLNENSKIKHVTAYSFCDIIISLYLIIYCILSMCFTCGLLFYHLRIIINNYTTKENLKHFFNNNFGNPYKRKILENIGNVLSPIIKKHNILEILRGDIKEICDYSDNENDNDNDSEVYKQKEKTKDGEDNTHEELNINNCLLKDLNNSKHKNEKRKENDDYVNPNSNNIFNTERNVNDFNNINKEDSKKITSKSVKNIKFEQKK